MAEETKERVFMEFCEGCRRKHRMIMRPCPSCGGRSGEWVPQPVSDAVADNCRGIAMDNECTGCEAYKDHLR